MYHLLAQATEIDYGFGGQAPAIAVQPSLILENQWLALTVYFVIAIAALLVLANIVRIFTRRLYNRFNPFEMVTLRILLPKESLQVKEQTEKKEPRQLIAPIESLMANLAGLRAERGLPQWFFGRRDHFAFEIVAHEGVISFYFTVPQEMRQYVEQQIQAQHPDAFIEEREDYNIFASYCAIAGVNLRFKKSYFFPIRTYKDMDADPLNGLTNALSKFREVSAPPSTLTPPSTTTTTHSFPSETRGNPVWKGEGAFSGGGAAIQFVVRSAHPRWHQAASRLAREVRQGKKLSDAVKIARAGIAMSAARTLVKRTPKKEQMAQQNKPFTPLSKFDEEALAKIQEKSAKSGFDVNVRIVVATESQSRSEAQLAGIADSFAQYSGYEFGNGFKKVKPRRLGKFLRDFIYRNFTERHRMVLNTEEMASLFHFPLPASETPNILWLSAKQASAPVNIPKEGIILGHNVYRGEDVIVRLKEADRRRHLYVIGKSGVGKSVLLGNMIKQDLEAGRGVGVIDPHGELAEAALSYVPPSRFEDVIYFDPGDIDRPMGLNMLEYKDESQKDFAVQEMIAIFMKLFPPEVIGPMFEHNMRNVMLTLMADKEYPGTIVDIPRMFTDPDYQKYKLAKLNDPNVRQFWEQEMAKTTEFHKSEMLGYLISKVGRFVENEMMRNIIGQPKSAFDFREVMDKKKILIINLSKGKTGEVNSSLLGLIIVAKLQMAAMTRAAVAEEERHDFYLYIDEFQNFITDSIATILSEARKYRLDLIIAHQYIGQLVSGQDTKIRDAVFGNVGTLVSFKIGVEDAETIAKEFAPVFNEYDVINIDKYQAYVKLLIDNAPARPFNMATEPPAPGNRELTAKLKEYSRLKYGVERSLVEEDINFRLQLGKKVEVGGGATPGEALR